MWFSTCWQYISILIECTKCKRMEGREEGGREGEREGGRGGGGEGGRKGSRREEGKMGSIYLSTENVSVEPLLTTFPALSSSFHKWSSNLVRQSTNTNCLLCCSWAKFTPWNKPVTLCMPSSVPVAWLQPDTIYLITLEKTCKSKSGTDILGVSLVMS